jgi:hypothetical protein
MPGPPVCALDEGLEESNACQMGEAVGDRAAQINFLWSS